MLCHNSITMMQGKLQANDKNYAATVIFYCVDDKVEYTN